MFLVLLLVPAVLAVQADIGRQYRALLRGLRAEAAPRARGLLCGASGASLLWFALTLGRFIVTGAMFGPLTGAGLAGALGLFLAGTLGIVLIVYALGFVLLRARPVAS
jgi:hypothetical protein